MNNNITLTSGVIGDKNNCVMLKSGQIGIITKFLNTIISIDIVQSTPFFNEPVNSQLLGIYKLFGNVHSEFIIRDDIHSKMMIIPEMKYDTCSKTVIVPENNYYVAIKILHTH